MKSLQIGTLLLLISAFLLGCVIDPNHQQENGDVVSVMPADTVVSSDTGDEEKGLDLLAGDNSVPANNFRQNCASCHSGGVPKAPHLAAFPLMRPEVVLSALTEGAMVEQARELDYAEKVELAEFLTGQRFGESKAVPVLQCNKVENWFDPTQRHGISNWGVTPENTRFVSAENAQLTQADVGELRLKWAFGYPNATRARSQPAIAGGAVFVGSQDGTVYALDLESGCARWTYKADAEVRTGLSIELLERDDGVNEPRGYFGDFAGNVYSVNLGTGELNWRAKIDDHPDVTITASTKFYQGVLYVSFSSKEWATAADPAYECCTARGGVAALDPNTGKELWKTYSIADEPKPVASVNKIGTRQWHAAGAPVWTSPTIDSQRNVLYVGTGNAYTSPAADTSDAVLAMDLQTGELLWSFQTTAGDAWNLACVLTGAGRTNCPSENGPDFDVGTAPLLMTLADGRQLLMVGAKSGVVHALDPDKNGSIVWKRRVGYGGLSGGVHWGMSAINELLFVPISDADILATGDGLSQRKPGLHALNALTGETVWYSQAPDVCADDQKPACDRGFSAAVTAIPSMIFAGSFDGHLRIYSADKGDTLWDFNTAQNFLSVNGEAASGGSIESDGPIVSNGKVLVNSGYSFGGRMGGNVLLVFASD